MSRTRRYSQIYLKSLTRHLFEHNVYIELAAKAYIDVYELVIVYMNGQRMFTMILSPRTYQSILSLTVSELNLFHYLYNIHIYRSIS